jgi:hypothetical protein
MEEFTPAGWKRARVGNAGAAEQSRSKTAGQRKGLVVRPWGWVIGKEPGHPVRMSDARHAGEGVLGWAHTFYNIRHNHGIDYDGSLPGYTLGLHE